MRPRITVCDGGVARLLEEEVAELLQSGERVKVNLRGAPGTGKTAALQHLAAVFAGDARLCLRDSSRAVPGDFLVEIATRRAADPAAVPTPHLREWGMARWTNDECLEYLRTAHPERVAAAWSAFCASDAQHDLLRWPQLCTAVLDVLAGPNAPADALQGLRVVLASVVEDDAERMLALQSYLPSDSFAASLVAGVTMAPLASRTARALLAAERLVTLATDLAPFASERLRWDGHLVIAGAVVLQQEPALAERLREHVRSHAEQDVRLALSLLAVAHQGFRPEPERLHDLSHTFLAGANLREKTVAGNCRRVHLARADLQHAVLDDCVLDGATLRDARAIEASLRRVHGPRLQAQMLVGDGLVADGARLRKANFAGASLRGAQFAYADLGDAHLDGAYLRGANFDHATLSHCDLRGVSIAAANLQAASLDRVTASGVSWDDLHAPESRWWGADLTGARWQRARLAGASFRDCRLAHVDWQDADLRNTDFTGAIFHLGNARSGLVGSEIACEGSRTGFYTDESFDDQLRDPETVRKANLGGADLRGAKLDGVDLYLVDLRGAKLDDAQREWAKRCRALLQD